MQFPKSTDLLLNFVRFLQARGNGICIYSIFICKLLKVQIVAKFSYHNCKIFMVGFVCFFIRNLNYSDIFILIIILYFCLDIAQLLKMYS